MKNQILLFSFFLISSSCFAKNLNNENQDPEKHSYSLIDCSGCGNKYFLATNSGIKYTLLGLRFGFLCKTGGYAGIRFGKGKVYHNESDLTTTKTTLFSITGGLIKPVYTQDKFSLYVFAGVGYGQWWDYRRESWTKEGYELEGGLMISYGRLMFNLGANRLAGYKTYATHDFSVGLGYKF